jgi:hypothetical protein
VSSEAELSEAEQAAWDRVLETFPTAEVLPSEADADQGQQTSTTHPDSVTKLTTPDVLAEADAALVEDNRPSSWRSVDLKTYLEGGDTEQAPSILCRTDGQGLLYETKRNELHGAYESGKSWVAAIAAVEVIRAGGVVVWLDFEDSPTSMVGRLLALGLSEEEIVAGFRYVQPIEPLSTATEIDLRLELVGASLVVIDAANEAMAAAGLDPNANRDIAAWYSKVPRLATHAGATVLVLDHVAKRPDQQRGAVGGGHKQAAIDGASYRLDVITPFGRGSKGLLRLRLTKDRPGYLRGVLGQGKEPAAAEIAIDGTDPEALSVDVRPPADPSSESWQPTRLMERVSRWVEDVPQPVSQREILDGVTGKRDYLTSAIAELVRGGYLKSTPGARGAHLHVSERPFREVDA